jgi:hypothetical protein
MSGMVDRRERQGHRTSKTSTRLSFLHDMRAIGATRWIVAAVMAFVVAVPTWVLGRAALDRRDSAAVLTAITSGGAP